MSSVFKKKKPEGPSAEELKRRRALEDQTAKLQREQMEEGREKDAEIASAQYKLRKKSKGRSSLLSGSAAGVQDDTLG